MGSSGCDRCCLFIISAFLIRLSKNHSTVLKPAPMTIKLVPSPTNKDLLDSLLSLSFVRGTTRTFWNACCLLIMTYYWTNYLSDIEFIFFKSWNLLKVLYPFEDVKSSQRSASNKGGKERGGRQGHAEVENDESHGYKDYGQLAEEEVVLPLTLLYPASTGLLGNGRSSSQTLRTYLVLKVEEISRYRFVL